MPQDMDAMLRNSLDAVDRGRRWTLLGIAVMFFGVTIALAALFGAGARNAPSENAPPLKAMWVGAAAQMLFVACCTAVVMFHVTRMTKAMLRAIELAAKRN